MISLFRLLAGVTALVVLAQALLAGQWIGGNLGVIATHGWLGNGTFVLTLILVGLSVAGLRQGWLESRGVVVTGLLALLMVAQLGLGYAGRSSSGAAALHVPLGVLIFGLVLALFVAVLPLRLAPAADPAPRG